MTRRGQKVSFSRSRLPKVRIGEGGTERKGKKRRGERGHEWINEREREKVVQWTDKHSIQCWDHKYHVNYKKVKAPSKDLLSLTSTPGSFTSPAHLTALTSLDSPLQLLSWFSMNLQKMISAPKVQLKTLGIRWVTWPAALYPSYGQSREEIQGKKQ